MKLLTDLEDDTFQAHCQVDYLRNHIEEGAAIRQCRDAVEAGEFEPARFKGGPTILRFNAFMDKAEPAFKGSSQQNTAFAWRAYKGSVDAAIALLEAVLPRTQFHLSDEASGDGYVGQIFDCELDRYTGTGHDAIASRALLLAILNAMIERGSP